MYIYCSSAIPHDSLTCLNQSCVSSPWLNSSDPECATATQVHWHSARGKTILSCLSVTESAKPPSSSLK